jgi:RNA polymerase sigma-70 factor (ECF subfamily)
MTIRESIKEEFCRLIDDSMKSMYQLALRLTRNSTDAEDLVAESIASAWAAFQKLEDKNRFRPWILKILHNGFISQYRKRSRHPTEVPYVEEGESTDDQYDLVNLLLNQPPDFLAWWANPEKVIINQFMGDDILKAMDQLPDVYRETVILVTIEGLSYDEAAEVIEVPPGTIRSRMKRGRTLLQKNLWQHALDAGLHSSKQSGQKVV